MTQRTSRSSRRESGRPPTKGPRKTRQTRATDASPRTASARRRPALNQAQRDAALPAILVWVVAGALAYYVGQTHWYVAWLLGGTLSLLALYIFDKQQAQQGGQRVPESVLKGMALAGGVLGGWLGMLGLRHKTQHPEFWTMQWAATAIHAILAFVLFRT